MAFIRTNSAVRGISGKSGNTYYSETQAGIQWKNNPIVTKPATPTQLANRARLKQAAATYRAMTPAQHAAWAAYALTITKTNRAGVAVHPTGYNAFTGLACKFLQVNPDGTIPTDPPTAPFAGDRVTISATASPGQLTFRASGANAPSVVTEILWQLLPNASRKPQRRGYGSQGFVAFTSAGGRYSLFPDPGAYAVAYRFVDGVTGQEVALVPIGTVVIPD